MNPINCIFPHLNPVFEQSKKEVEKEKKNQVIPLYILFTQQILVVIVNYVIK